MPQTLGAPARHPKGQAEAVDDEVLAGVPVDEPPDVDALLPSEEPPLEPDPVDELPESLVLEDSLDDEPFDDEPAVTDEPERESVR